MREVTDPNILAELEGAPAAGGRKPVTDPAILSMLEPSGSAAARIWDLARGAVKAINKTAAGEADVSNIVAPTPVPRVVAPGDPALAWGMPAPTSFAETKAVGASALALPSDLLASSIAGLTGITELATGGGLRKAGKTIEKTTEALSPTAAIQPLMSEETKAAQERQMATVGAMIPPGGVAAQAGEALGMDKKYAPLVEAAVNIVAIGVPVASPYIAKTTWWRKLTIRDRRLVLSTVDQMKASGMSEADIIRVRPEEWQKAFEKRGGGAFAESTVETPTPAAARPPVEPPGSTIPPVMAPEPPAPLLRAPITPEVIPTPPRVPEAPAPPTAALGSPEFYKAEADRLGVQFAGITETGLPSRPKMVVFQDGDNRTGAGSFTLDPGESVEQALTRARARYETPQPTAEAGPVAVPEPATPGSLANLPKEGSIVPVQKAGEIPPEPVSPVPPVPAVPVDRVVGIDRELAVLDAKYKDFLAKPDNARPPAIKKGILDGIARKMDALDAEKVKLSTEIPQAEPPVQTPGQKFANVRDIKSKQKKAALEPTLQQRILRAGGIKITPESRGEFAKYGLRQGEGALARLFRSEKHSGYSKAMDWSQWADTLIRDGTLGEHATIDDLMDAIKSNKRPHGAGITDEELAKEAAKSAEKVARETVPENEIALGDSFRIDNEKFKAVRYDERGRLVIKDGVEHRLGPGDDIRVDGGREGVIPGEIPKAAEKVPPTLEEAVKQLLPEIAKSDKELTPNEIIGIVRNFAEKNGLEFDSMAARKEVVDALRKSKEKGQQDLIKDKSFKLAEEPTPEGPAPEFKPEAAGAQDELFPGERAKYRAPEKAPPAAPPEGGLFSKGGGEEAFAPEADFRKKPGEPVDEGAPMSRSGIAKFLSEKFDIPLRVGRFRNALGIFKVGPEVIRTRLANDIEVIAHEIGHALHKFLWPDARTSGGGLSAGPLRAFQDELIPIATKPRAGGSKNAEGFAEFIRKYVVNPDEAKQVAPKFFKFFEDKLDADAPDVKAILLKARADYKRWLEQPSLARVMGSINRTPDTSLDISFSKLYTAVVDSLYPFEEVVKEMAKAKKIDDVPPNLNPYKLAHLMAGWKGKPDAWLEYKPFRFRTYKFYEGVKPLRDIYKPIEGNEDLWDAYRVSRRTLKIGQDKSGILMSDARKVIEDMERDHPEFVKALDELKKYRRALNQYIYEAGVIDTRQFVEFNRGVIEEDYSPFYRVMDYEQQGGTSKRGYEITGSPVRHLKGSWRDIISPTESDIKQTYAFIHAAEKNAIGKALVDLSRQAEGMGKFVEKIPADTRRIAVKDTELEDMLRKYGKWTETTQFQTTEKVIRESIKDETGADIPADERGTRIMKERAVEALKTRGYSQAEAETIVSRIASAKNETARSRIIERVTERATVRNTVREFGIDIPEGLAYIYRKSPDTPKGNVITVMIKGKPTFYEVDKRIYDTFHALDKETSNTIIRIMAIPARLLRAGATLTPEFALGKNPIRDQWTAFINSKYGYKPHFDMARGLYSAIGKDAAYWRWKIGGGEHTAMVSMDREYFDKTYKEIMQDHGLKATSWHVITSPIDALRMLSELTESGTRIGEFKAGLRKLGTGKGAIQNSAYASREVTLPFSRAGAKVKALNQIIAFWNANIQDLDKIHRQFKEYPRQTTLRLIASITIPSILLAWATHDDKDIKEVAQWQKDIFWLFPTGRIWTAGPWKGSPIIGRIPKPFVMGILFGSFPERIVHYAMDKDPHAFDGLMDSLSRGAAPSWMPTFANPIIEGWANKSRFTNRQIVPRAREDLSPQYQYAPYTTETAKKIGGLLAKIPGMKGSDLENLIVSPAKLENMIRGYTGGLGMWALRAANTSLGVAGVVPTRVEPTKKLADYPLISAFVVRYPTADSESVQRFFDDYKEAETNLKTSKFLFKKFDPKPAAKILSEEDVAKLVMVKTALTNAHRIVDAVYENPKMTPEEKSRIIDQTYINMTVMARAGNKVLDKYKEAKKAAAK